MVGDQLALVGRQRADLLRDRLVELVELLVVGLGVRPVGRGAGQGDGASDGIQAMNELYRAKVPGNLPTIQTIASFMNDYQSLGRTAA